MMSDGFFAFFLLLLLDVLNFTSVKLTKTSNYEKCFSIIDDAGLCIRQKDASCNVHDQEPC